MNSQKSFRMFTAVCFIMTTCLMFTAGCKPPEEKPEKKSDASPTETSDITIAGSSTVEPVSSKMAELASSKGVKVVVKGGGTGAGMSQLASNKLDIADASRTMKANEAEACAKNNVKYINLQIGVDGVTVVVNKKNTFCKCLTVAQLKKLWEKESKVTKWKELDPSWPDKEIKLYGPDAASGTFDYFCEEILGAKKKEGEEEAARSRRDYLRNSDDNVLVKGVSEDEFALGYFGYSFYVNNKEVLNAVSISKTDKYEDGIVPNDENIDSGKYSPLSRPLFLYVNVASLKRPEVQKFLEFYLENANEVVKQVHYINVKPAVMEANKKTLADAVKSLK